MSICTHSLRLYLSSSNTMGQQHNTHVANDTNESIKIVLTDNNARNISQVIAAKDACCIPTPKGVVTVSVFSEDPEDPEDPTGKEFLKIAAANYTDNSDRSFIVKKDNKDRVNIYRAKYGTIWQVESGVRLRLPVLLSNIRRNFNKIEIK